LRDLGLQDLKGVAGSTRAFAALRESSRESRFEALHAGGLTELVGREEETDLLLRRWQTAAGGEGQVVLLSGEAGIGKSRLTAAFLERLAGGTHTRMRYFCSPQHTESALYPIIGQMERAAGLAREDDAKARLDKLDTLLAMTATSREDAALFAEMLSLPNDSRYPVRELDPRQRRQKTMEALTGHIEAASRQSAVLMILEDAHWADPSSLEAFGRLVDRIDRLRVLLFVTCRPEFAAPWVGRSHVTALTINRLPPREVTALIEQVAGDRPLPSHLRQDIIERADGIPLFVEEMTKAVLEAEGDGAAERTAASVPSSALAVPASLHASLMARLDRLGPASREAAQIGAVIGREFSYELMLGVSRRGEAMTREALDRLVAAGLVLQRGIPPTAEYQFKHALVQDIAYGTLLRAPRKALHARIVEAVRARTPETVARAPEVFAHHLMEAGEFDTAATYWLEAGRRAVAQSADNEAAAHLARGISALSGLPDTPERDRKELALQLALGPALLSNQGYGNDVTTAYRRAEELAVRLGDDRARFAAIWGLWISEARHVGTVDDPSRHLGQLVEIADRIGDPGLVLQAHHSAWTTWAQNGEFARSLEHVRKGMALYDPEKHRRHALVYGGHDPGVCGHGNRAMAAWALGYPDQATQSARDGVALAETLGHMPSLLHSLWFSGTHYCVMRDFVAARDCGDRLLALGREHGLMFYQAIGGVVRGWALSQIRDGVNGLEELRSSFGRYSAGIKTNLEVYRAGLVEAELRAGNFERASASLFGIETGGAKYWGAELLRLRGEMQRSGPDRDEAPAERSYREAIGVAQRQQAKSLELRAATSLARLWRDQGKRDEARNLLAPVYGWFTEGFETLDLKEAKALLEALA
jgi:predicted ATPase